MAATVPGPPQQTGHGRPASRQSGRPAAGRLLTAGGSAVLALVLGGLTALGQAWLPPQVSSLANSSGSWSLVAFLLSSRAWSARSAALLGPVALGALLTGYVLTNEARGFPSSTATLVFWGTAALLAGPLLGLAGHWSARDRGTRAAVGAGGMSGVLVGEGAYGLLYVAGSTSPVYWSGSVAVGVLLLVVVALRLTGARARLVATAAAATTAAVFVVAYRDAGSVLGLLG